MKHVNVWYLAHPVGGDVAANLARAGRWLRWLRLRCPNAVIIAPWLAPLLAGLEDDSNPEDRERGLRDCCAVVERCDGIVLTGGRVSTGMQRELAHAPDSRRVDLTSLGDEPPTDVDGGPPTEDVRNVVRDVSMMRWRAK